MIYYGDAGQYVKETPSVFRKILFEKNHIFLPCTELIKDKRPSNIYLVHLIIVHSWQHHF